MDAGSVVLAGLELRGGVPGFQCQLVQILHAGKIARLPVNSLELGLGHFIQPRAFQNRVLVAGAQ